MLGFEKEKYVEMGNLVQSKRTELEAIGQKLYERNVKSIFFTGVGGTTAEFNLKFQALKESN